MLGSWHFELDAGSAAVLMHFLNRSTLFIVNVDSERLLTVDRSENFTCFAMVTLLDTEFI